MHTISVHRDIILFFYFLADAFQRLFLLMPNHQSSCIMKRAVLSKKTTTDYKNTISLDTDGRLHVFRRFFLFALHYRKHQVQEARLIRTCRLLISFASLYLWPCSNIRWSSMQSVFFQHQLQFLSRISYSTVRPFKVIEVMVDTFNSLLTQKSKAHVPLFQIWYNMDF